MKPGTVKLSCETFPEISTEFEQILDWLVNCFRVESENLCKWESNI